MKKISKFSNSKFWDWRSRSLRGFAFWWDHICNQLLDLFLLLLRMFMTCCLVRLLSLRLLHFQHLTLVSPFKVSPFTLASMLSQYWLCPRPSLSSICMFLYYKHTLKSALVLQPISTWLSSFLSVSKFSPVVYIHFLYFIIHYYYLFNFLQPGSIYW